MSFAFRPKALLRKLRPSLRTPDASVRTPRAAPAARLAHLGCLDVDEPDEALETWLDACTKGPRFGPKLVALASLNDANMAEALAGFAKVSRTSDRDLLIVDACGIAADLAAALDRRLGRRSRREDPFGAAARIEVLPLSELLPDGAPPDSRALRKIFDVMAAETDLVFIALPAIADWPAVPSLLAAADEIVLLRENGTDATSAGVPTDVRVAGVIDIVAR